MKTAKRPKRQYTIRSIPEDLDRALREYARRAAQSLNQAALDALRRGLSLPDSTPRRNDLDDLAGLWIEDPAFEETRAEFERIDEDAWR
ncbi:MAG: hypothetical protein U1D55_17195 [Phycisphaerae bacterium]